MAEVKVIEDGQTDRGNKTFTVTIDGDGKGRNLTKVEAIMTLWAALDLTQEEWLSLRKELHKIED